MIDYILFFFTSFLSLQFDLESNHSLRILTLPKEIFFLNCYFIETKLKYVQNLESSILLLLSWLYVMTV